MKNYIRVFKSVIGLIIIGVPWILLATIGEGLSILARKYSESKFARWFADISFMN
jgi:hypothetical protein